MKAAPVERNGTVPLEAEAFVTVLVEAHSFVTVETDGFITVEEIAVTNPHSAMRGMDPMDAARWRADVSHIIEGRFRLQSVLQQQ